MNKKGQNKNEIYDETSNLQKFIIKYKEKFNTLTVQEVEVLALIAKGINSPVIAERLKNSRLAVQNHRLSIQSKLEIESRADFVKYALAFDLISF